MKAPVEVRMLADSGDFSGVHLPPQCSVTELRFFEGFGLTVSGLRSILTNLPALRCRAIEKTSYAEWVKSNKAKTLTWQIVPCQQEDKMCIDLHPYAFSFCDQITLVCYFH